MADFETDVFPRGSKNLTNTVIVWIEPDIARK